MTYSLQSRWKLKGNQLVYHGLQNKENLFKNKIKISRRQAEIISLLKKQEYAKSQNNISWNNESIGFFIFRKIFSKIYLFCCTFVALRMLLYRKYWFFGIIYAILLTCLYELRIVDSDYMSFHTVLMSFYTTHIEMTYKIDYNTS